jgi:hypothetical protein
MRKWLVFFGAVDIFAFFGLLKVIRFNYNSLIQVSAANAEIERDGFYYFLQINSVLNIALVLSFILSAFLLLRMKRAGLILTYIQFPVKLFCGVSAFGFLRWILSWTGHIFPFSIILIVCMTLELGRLILTIMIQRKYYLPKKPSEMLDRE